MEAEHSNNSLAYDILVIKFGVVFFFQNSMRQHKMTEIYLILIIT